MSAEKVEFHSNFVRQLGEIFTKPDKREHTTDKRSGKNCTVFERSSEKKFTPRSNSR